MSGISVFNKIFLYISIWKSTTYCFFYYFSLYLFFTIFNPFWFRKEQKKQWEIQINIQKYLYSEKIEALCYTLHYILWMLYYLSYLFYFKIPKDQRIIVKYESVYVMNKKKLRYSVIQYIMLYGCYFERLIDLLCV